ncbi:MULTISPECIES: hypothetical protein [Streptomyces]|uniref:Transcriptional regulator GlxA family with amidase domain n=1 Tax=Streptomyces stelliscabiei TaxID=146820 RepID=A0A8I0NWW9_9ACTN|nr:MULTISPECIES: hypothetical protein [Streptomyces]MBE1595108.1 transcriptional regulator GlxA family with amidase domain [Streptomyces stelliscabiei]
MHAQTLLGTTDLPIERVSEFGGLGTAANLRRHFTLRVGVTPSDYRQSFGAARPAVTCRSPAAVEPTGPA